MIETLGDYTILKEIGQGSFGTVYLAEHRFIRKQFALKLLSPELFRKPGFLTTFEKEVALLSKLSHPAIVKIHNISQHDGQYFIVMDPIIDSLGDTMNLERLFQLRQRPFSEEEIETILRQVASALSYAKQMSSSSEPYFHGSIKPKNILVSKIDGRLRVYLTDFGLFQLLGKEIVLQTALENFTHAMMVSEDLDHTKKGELMRSYQENFAFLAPEQKELGATTVDAHADIYAFGVLTYYLLQSKFPEGVFELPSKTHPELQYNWDKVIIHCMKMNPSERFEDLNTLLDKYLVANPEQEQMSSWDEIEEQVENTMQMSFEFNQEKASAGVEQQEKIAEQPTRAGPPVQKRPPTQPKFQSVHAATANPRPVLHPPKIERPKHDPDPGAIFQRELMVSHYQPKKEEVQEVEPLLTPMVVIPTGTYDRGSAYGSRDEMPRHAITVDSFAIDVHPVTNEQFVRFLQAMGGEKDLNNNDIIRLRDSRIKRNTGKVTIESGYAKHPVVGVTWYGATAYAKWVGKRLPFEAEWEIAAYGGKEDNLYPTGQDIERSQANFFSADTTAVQSYPCNGYEIFDMAGNVYEWCQDWYAYNYYDTSMHEPENPKGPPQGVYRVLRGGCWKSLKEDLRCSHRHRNNPGAINRTYGFRCAADAS